MGTGSLPVTDQGLFPAEHRALRELYALARQLGGHWARLAGKLDPAPEVLDRGVEASKELLAELADRTAAYGLHGVPAATGAGVWTSRLRGAGDLLLERNQALRGATLDLQHVITLLAYLAALAARRDDLGLAEWLSGWETRLRAIAGEIQAAVVAEAEDPERAVQPYDSSKLGRAGHKMRSASARWARRSTAAPPSVAASRRGAAGRGPRPGPAARPSAASRAATARTRRRSPSAARDARRGWWRAAPG